MFIGSKMTSRLPAGALRNEISRATEQLRGLLEKCKKSAAFAKEKVSLSNASASTKHTLVSVGFCHRGDADVDRGRVAGGSEPQGARQKLHVVRLRRTQSSTNLFRTVPEIADGFRRKSSCCILPVKV